MRALITGITGFVGSHLAHHLARRGWRVSGLATGPSPVGLEAFDVRQVDVADRASLAKAIEDADPEVVFHLAGLAHVGASWKEPADYLRVNVGGTQNLLAAVGSRRFLFASSAEVYGQVPAAEQPLAESRPLAPRSPYAMTKAYAELLVVAGGGIAVRSFNAIGPEQSRQFALPSFAYQLAQIHLGKMPPRISVGDLSPRRDFLHIEDAVEGYRLLAEKGEAGEAYNLASGQATMIRDALKLLQQVSGVEAEVVVDPSRVRKIDIPLLQGDIAKITALGFAIERTLEDALRDLWRSTLAAASREAEAETPEALVERRP